ncbi:hypothetical protein HWV00_08710 [Moritella sp. 24]|uniref:hypothetical protein n=1 Tax=Moritella sp. 24 TaxID=2746230 RepID=UPI001BACA49D|nr:hypothetical protein [Moritella sp. 24]QUM76291.1 hypothetical protein HWV00_08710 [Moritella sp. 24]
MKQLICIFVMLTTLSACAVFPTTRIYFKPMNANNDSELAKSQSCGYHKAKYDGLKKTVGDTDISIFPHLVEGENLSAVLFLETTNFGTEVDVDDVYIIVNGSNKALIPSLVSSVSRRPNAEGDKEMIWYKLEFNIVVDEIDTLRLDYRIQPEKRVEFEFKKTEQSDIYYASINC